MYYLQEGSTRREGRKLFSLLGWSMAALLVAQLGAQILLLVPVVLLQPELLNTNWLLSVIGNLSVYGVGFPVALLVLRSRPAPPLEEGAPFSFGELARMYFMCLGGMYLANLVTLGLMELLSALRGAPLYNPVDGLADQPVVLNLITGCILAPLAEEGLFRGAVLRRLRPYGEGFAILGSALLFALMHANLYQMLYAFVLGLPLAWIVLQTGKLRYTIGLHAGINFISMGLLPLMGLLGDLGDGLLSMLVLSSMVYGGIMLVRWGRWVRGSLEPGRVPMSGGAKGKAFFGNPGMVVLLVLAGLLVYGNLGV